MNNKRKLFTSQLIRHNTNFIIKERSKTFFLKLKQDFRTFYANNFFPFSSSFNVYGIE